jgi:hypothetical protein
VGIVPIALARNGWVGAVLVLLMINASTLAMKSHKSIPCIWLQETDKVGLRGALRKKW